ncbi:MAG: carbamate kinase [Nitrospirae bacterium]|nr:carbamate kinase [Nitrospirota bacterium]
MPEKIEKILVALGGNALVQAGQRGAIEEQRANVCEALADVVGLIRQGHRVLITHGNGPQVGHALLRAESARGLAYDLPLDVCVAQSQGETGYLIQQCLQNLLHRAGINHRPVATVVTRTVVDRADPRMTQPTKPIGPFYTNDQAAAMRAGGWRMVEDAHRGYRRVVSSPLPLRIVEAEVIQRLVEEGVVVVAVGGGGIPVSVSEDGALTGVEAVVDKDLASSVLAVELGMDLILDLTSVEQVYLNFGQPQAQPLASLTVTEAKTYLAQGHFAPGSMGPKIESAIHFLEHGGRKVVVTEPAKAQAALAGKAGTHITPDSHRGQAG